MLSKLSMLLRTAWWKPFDVGTEQGRAQERYRRALLTTVANVLSKLLSMLILMVSVPLTLSYLGTERFGIWTTISSFTMLLSFLDFGIGNGLVNQVAREAALEQHGRLRQVISNGLLVLLIVGVLVGGSLLLISRYVPWSEAIKVGDPAAVSEIRDAAGVFAVIFGISLPLVGLQRVFLGLQEGFRVHIASACSNLLALAMLWMVTRHQVGIPLLILATFGVQALSPVILLPQLLRRRLFGSTSFSVFRADGGALLRTGGLFFVLQIGAIVGWGSDSVIISSMLGAGQAAILAVTWRLFQFVTQPLVMIINPLWSSYADAAARNDAAYIRRTLKMSMTLSLLLSAVGAGLVLLLHPWLILHWTGGTIEAPLLLAVAYAVWSVIDACGNSFAMFLNGLGVLRPQLIVVALFCAVAIPLKIVLIQQIGLPGVVLATIVTYLMTVALPYLTFLRPAWMRRLQ